MNDLTRLNIDLHIDAQKIASQLLFNNKSIEQNIINGIQKAIDSITEESAFEEAVCVATKKSIEKCVTDVIFGFNFQKTLKSVIEEKVSAVTGKYGEVIADKVFESLMKNND